MTSTSSEPRRRVSALDGLRGTAALVVVLNHLLRVLAPVNATYEQPRQIPPLTSAVFWIQYAPLRLLSAGDEAVLVFFVLSGFVLALAPFERERFDWVAYIPRRVVRLYLPASLVLAWVFYRFVESPSHRLSLRVGKLIEAKEPVHAGEI